ncbi:unnamed protein product [[Actinomadura] parvosata subsp. kistnae]|uniref:Uncharacterized protein n=1 Tax=[Actinomadura] parvosata subsp. kistnae TaxID=1909395 RepID=A0A1U9ZYB0_9ACTN|nr:hypothetical protein BKM31_17070 [Nonomuraea sp. ATCC 55076]SPL95759.1 unnamed protein product [Actinomadura parvosata subsp. kistnae]
MYGQGLGSLPRVEGAVFSVLRKVAGAFLAENIDQPVQYLRSPFEVGQAFVQRGACVALGVVQQSQNVMNAARLTPRR